MHELHFSPTQCTHSTNFAPLVMVAAISSLACGDNNA